MTDGVRQVASLRCRHTSLIADLVVDLDNSSWAGFVKQNFVEMLSSFKQVALGKKWAVDVSLSELSQTKCLCMSVDRPPEPAKNYYKVDIGFPWPHDIRRGVVTSFKYSHNPSRTDVRTKGLMKGPLQWSGDRIARAAQKGPILSGSGFFHPPH